MIIWISEFPEDTKTNSFPNLKLGRFVKESVDIQSSIPILRQITEIKEIHNSIGDSVSWFVPIGHGVDFDLLLKLKKTDLPLYICVNGLGDRSIQYLRKLLDKYDWKFVFDATQISYESYCNQLTWLNAQKESFTIKSSNQAYLSMAAVLNSDGFIITDMSSINIEGLIYQHSISQEPPRPLSDNEIDSVYLKEVFLIASLDLSEGRILQKGDLEIGTSTVRGLAPYLQTKIIGKTLRYSLAKGEALTFGIIHDSFYDK
jgi:hypothetical protein